MADPFFDALPVYAELERRCFSDPWTEQQLLEGYRTGYYVFTSVKAEDQTVGYAAGTICGDQGEIQRICVLPEFRHRGLAKRLLSELDRALRLAGCGELFLEVRRGNIPAISLYESYGFEQAGERKKYYRDEDALILRLASGTAPRRV